MCIQLFLTSYSGPANADGAAALPDAVNNENAGEMMRSVASLVDAMRDLLNNIRPNEADIDENDDSADDDLT